MCVFCISSIPILKCTIYSFEQWTSLFSLLCRQHSKCVMVHRHFKKYVFNDNNDFFERAKEHVHTTRITFLNMQSNGSNQTNGFEYAQQLGALAWWTIHLYQTIFIFLNVGMQMFTIGFFKKMCFGLSAMDMLQQINTLVAHVSILYVAETPNIVDKWCKIGLQKHPILWTSDARSAEECCFLTGSENDMWCQHVSNFLLSYNQLTNTWSKWSLATKDQRWLLTDEVWPIGQYLKSFLHQKQIYTNLFPNHIKSTIC